MQRRWKDGQFSYNVTPHWDGDVCPDWFVDGMVKCVCALMIGALCRKAGRKYGKGAHLHP